MRLDRLKFNGETSWRIPEKTGDDFKIKKQ